MVPEEASALHPSFLPRALVGIAIAPGHLPVFMVAAILELALVCEISGDGEFALTVFAIAVPVTLNIRILT